MGAIPANPLYYTDQIVNHLSPDDNDERWTQRYYTYPKHFEGPGHPVFMIMGGEGGIEPNFGIYYPFVADHLAKQFGAYVLQPEHRFYGTSQPLHGKIPTAEQRTTLINTEQAMMDYVRLLNYVQADLGCSTDRTSPEYCPVLTVGGSYPGFLSAMMRVVHSNVVDVAYSASAPMKFYDQTIGSDEYYDHITDVAENCSPGCFSSVRSTLSAISVELQKAGDDNFSSVATSMGICAESIPNYITTSKWRFDDLVNGANATRILFTNGLNDGWSVGGIKEDLSDSILALNLHTGAHHSDLSHVGPSMHDTREVKLAFKKISKILGGWIEEVKSEAKDRQASPPILLRKDIYDEAGSLISIT